VSNPYVAAGFSLGKLKLAPTFREKWNLIEAGCGFGALLSTFEPLNLKADRSQAGEKIKEKTILC
jgi:hypothetical protein